MRIFKNESQDDPLEFLFEGRISHVLAAARQGNGLGVAEDPERAALIHPLHQRAALIHSSQAGASSHRTLAHDL